MKEGNGGDRGEESEEWRMDNGTRQQIKAKRTKFTGNVHGNMKLIEKSENFGGKSQKRLLIYICIYLLPNKRVMFSISHSLEFDLLRSPTRG